ncbi:DUF371 domain-containing protein [Geoglobus acetivorans]|uniref:DUF371 domain-containing protein n=1 Tax=Geoglobus acetivorans TaxID=565033 RepID=A0A0A7GFQ2_GEOAI|nr:hypothetical protein GACE_1833 [Geoglobus acetivorans]
MMSGTVTDEIHAKGHENITARHRTTLEVTKDAEITPRGDCIVGVRADKSVKDLNEEIKRRIREGAELKISLILPDYGKKITFHAAGSEKLELTHPTDVVIRKSDYTCPRTLGIHSEIASADIDREFADLLRDRKTTVILRIEV